MPRQAQIMARTATRTNLSRNVVMVIAVMENRQ